MPTEFELLCSKGPYEPHLILSIYKILHTAPPLIEHSHAYMRKWSRVLQWPISLGDWGKIWGSTSKVSRYVAQKETAYKILMFCYRIPDFLLARKLTPSGQCWRCGLSLGTHYHMFWECLALTSFWTQVHNLLEKILDIPIPLNHIHLLLGLPYTQSY